MQVDNNKRLKGFTQRDINRINSENTHHIVRRWHNSFIAHKFNVGDIIMYAEQNNYNKRKRFQVVEITDLFTFIKPIKQNGQLGIRYMNLADYYSKFILDPLYVDHLMFNSDLSTFDPLQSVKNYKQQKYQIKKSFYKQYKKYKTFKTLMKKFISTLQIGDIFYRGNASYFYECKLISLDSKAFRYEEAQSGNECFRQYGATTYRSLNTSGLHQRIIVFDDTLLNATSHNYFSKTMPILDIESALCK